MPLPKNEELARQLLKVLIDANVEFFVCGGVAAKAHGLRKKINDLDIVYRRSRGNFRKIVDALSPLNPYPRGLEPGQEVLWNTSVLRDSYSLITVTDPGRSGPDRRTFRRRHLPGTSKGNDPPGGARHGMSRP